MANIFTYKDIVFHVGDEVKLNYKIKEDNKERVQLFDGIVLTVKGSSPYTRMITLRKITRSGIGVERIIPLSSPYIQDIKIAKKSVNRHAKVYYVRLLSDQQLRTKLYKVSAKKRTSIKTSEKPKHTRKAA